MSDLIRISEALHEKKIAQIADMISDSKSKKRIVLISGPSSSGKTTFAQRLSIQLRVNGMKPATISLDNYFVNREDTPKDENGEYDYEALEAIDVKLFNKQLNELIEGMEVEIPEFNFAKGTREPTGKKMILGDNSILVIEGIHGLNEKLTSEIPKRNKFKIYVSALTSMNIDDHNRIPTTDTRIIRRIVRDNQFRGSSAVSTIKRWPSVRRGEERNIFPFQESANVMFNSSLMVELGVLKSYAEPLLAEIDTSCQEYSEARRLIEFLSYFLPIDCSEIPHNSIIREFIGGSCFY
jgi:uridine kinase